MIHGVRRAEVDGFFQLVMADAIDLTLLFVSKLLRLHEFVRYAHVFFARILATSATVVQTDPT